MINKSYDLGNKIYSVVACSKEDIPSHTERVLSYWKATDTHIPTQYKYLESCVEADTAFKVVDTETNEDMSAMYIKVKSVHSADCAYMFMKNKRMLAILFAYIKEVYSFRDMVFVPHSKQFIPFKFLIPEMAIRLFRSNNEPIRISFNSKFCRYFMEDHFIRYGIKEIK